MTADLPLGRFTLLAAPLSGRLQWRSLQQHFAAIGGRHLRGLTVDRPSRSKAFLLRCSDTSAQCTNATYEHRA
ncbi:MAG: hypothetical protein SGI99_06845 [Pseudomonadota bacterium]|nr:hypothetical protein [Pseudomonadota bacterium]